MLCEMTEYLLLYVYTDFEYLLKPISSSIKTKTTNTHIHEAMGHVILIIVHELDCNDNKIHVFPNSKEKIHIFSKQIKGNFYIKFIDAFRFMSESLNTLAENLAEDKTGFKEILKTFSQIL